MMDISVIDVLSYYIAKASVVDEADIDWDLLKSIRHKLFELINQGFITVNYKNIPKVEYDKIDRIMCDLMVDDINRKYK